MAPRRPAHLRLTRRIGSRAWTATAMTAAMSTLTSACRERVTPLDAAAASPAVAAAVPLPMPALAPQLSYPRGSSVEVVAMARSSVVAIRSRSPVKSGPAAMLPGAPDAVADVALGTGFLIDAKGPYILTTDRIAGASTQLTAVMVDGVELGLKVVGRDARLDIALLSIVDPVPPRLPTLSLGTSSPLQVGEWLLVLGNPFGDEVTASAGLVSATGRDAVASMVAGPAMAARSLVQTDARIHRGNSGGPALNTAGQVIGVATATSERPTELSFVVPIDRITEVLESLRETGRVDRAWLGAMVKPVPAQLATELGIGKDTGAWITQVLANSPALRSSLRVGDVVTRWNGRDIDHRTLPWAVASTPAGRPVPVLVWRAGAPQELPVTTEPMPQ